MLKCNGMEVPLGYFPDGTLHLNLNPKDVVEITWIFESNEEMAALWFLAKHLRTHGRNRLMLRMPYIPNARQDRVKVQEDVFTLKYFAEFINALEFDSVKVLDPHSAVSEALLDRVEVEPPHRLHAAVLERLGTENLIAFYPDEGAMKRYSGTLPYAFGIKKRDWATGQIQGLDVAGETDRIAGSRILIVDDICSRGGTFYHSAKKLKALGAAEIYLCVTHCENTILEGELLTSGLIACVFTANTIFTKEHPMVEVIPLV